MPLPSDLAVICDQVTDSVMSTIRSSPVDSGEGALDMRRVIAYQLITGERSVDPALPESYVLAAAAGRAIADEEAQALRFATAAAGNIHPGTIVADADGIHGQVTRIVRYVDRSKPDVRDGVQMVDLWFADGYSESMSASMKLRVVA